MSGSFTSALNLLLFCVHGQMLFISVGFFPPPGWQRYCIRVCRLFELYAKFKQVLDAGFAYGSLLKIHVSQQSKRRKKKRGIRHRQQIGIGHQELWCRNACVCACLYLHAASAKPRLSSAFEVVGTLFRFAATVNLFSLTPTHSGRSLRLSCGKRGCCGRSAQRAQQKKQMDGQESRSLQR